MSKGVIDAVLPVTVADMPRARLLLRSLSARFECLGTLYVVAPGHQCGAVESGLAGLCAGVQVLSESEVVPELAWLGHVRGWYRQQLVKLAIANRVSSEFYLTLDADVLCTRRTTLGQLLDHDGACPRAGVSVLPDSHPDWYAHSIKVLGLPAKRTGLLHNVTPALLSREGVLGLQAHLAQRAANKAWASGLRGVKQRAAMARFWLRKPTGFERWRLWLGSSTPWTEYALYYSFLESTGRYEAYHFDTERCLYDVQRSVWKADGPNFQEWDPAQVFDCEDGAFFVVVQSVANVPVTAVQQKIERFL